MNNTKNDARSMKQGELASTYISEKKKGDEKQHNNSNKRGGLQGQPRPQEKTRESLPSKNNKRFVFEVEESAGIQENSQHS